MIDRERWKQRLIKLFPECPIENIDDYIDYAREGIDTLSDEQLDNDFEDFSSK